MPRLPQPGGDSGNWGQILNDYLSQTHNTDGSLKANVVDSTALAPNAVTAANVATSGGTDGQVLVKDSSQTSGMKWSTVTTGSSNPVGPAGGDLAGTYPNPTVPGLAAKADTVHAHAQTDVTGLTAALAGKEATIAAGTTSQYYRGDKSWQTLDKSAVGLANVDNTSDANKPVSSATVTALAGKASTVHTHAQTDVTGLTAALSAKADTAHSHTSADVSDFTEATQDVMNSTLVAGTNVTLNYNDPAGTLTISATPGAGVTDLTNSTTANDVTVISSTGLDTALAAATVTDAGVMSAADKTKLNGISAGATANSSDATLLDRTNHTGSQAQSTVTNLVSDLAGKEATITAGTTSQYYRGDKSWQTLDKSAVGLANVDNTSDANKPVSSATQTALNAKANNSVTVTGATSLTGGGDLTANRTLSLVGDAASPGNSQYYGTDGAGSKGYHALPAGGSDATTLAKGIVQLAGDLGGTAALPTVPTKVDKDVTITANGPSQGWWQHLFINYTALTSDNEPIFVESNASGSTVRVFWLNENGVPRTSASKSGEVPLKINGLQTGGQTANLTEWNDRYGGLGRVVYAIDKDGLPVIGLSGGSTTPGAHTIVLAALDPVPTGLPAGTVIIRKS